MAYLQAGQWDPGETIDCPSGNRCMQTLRKLPTMEPSTKNTTDKKWNGIADQTAGSNAAFTIVVDGC
jgi:hypothetical protein